MPAYFHHNPTRLRRIRAVVAALMFSSALALTAQAAPAHAQPPAPSADAGAQTLFNFERGVNWKRRAQAHGTLARSTEQKHAGAASAKLAYTFPATADNFVVFESRQKLAGAPAALSAWVFGDGSGHFLNAWLQDGAGQVRQFTFGRVTHTGWQQMIAPLHQDARPWPANSHVSGPDAGKLAPPYTFRALVLDGVPDGAASNGAIYIDDVEALDQLPSAAAVSTPGQAAAAAAASTAGITVEVVKSASSDIARPLVMDANPGQSLANCPQTEQNPERLVRLHRFLLRVTNGSAAPWPRSAVSARFTTSGGKPAFACRNSASGLDPVAQGSQVNVVYLVLTELYEGLSSGVLVVDGVGEAAIALPQAAASPAGSGQLEVAVQNNRASYRQWGKPKAADSCETNDALGATYKFDLVIELTNATAGDLSDLKGYFIGESGQKLFLCGVLPNLPSGYLKSTPVHTFADQWVQELVLTDAQGKTLARQCFAKPEGTPDVAVVACAG